MSDLMTAAEAAQRLRLSARKVYELAASGEIACHRFGGAVRFDPTDLDAYKTKCRSPAITRAAGSTSLTRSLRESESDLTSYFQKARPGKKPPSTTSAKRRNSGTLQLVAANPTA
jgi:putative molybdopterin biosynthesis protein